MPVLRRIGRTNLPIHGNDDTKFPHPSFCAIDFAKSRHKRTNSAVIRQFFVDNCINDLISLQGSNPCNRRNIVVRYFFSGDLRERTRGILFHSIVQILFGKALRPNAEEAVRAKDIRGTIEANLWLFT